jgi:hypothetical protein
MGSWDVGAFDNDTAVDWTYGLEASSDLSYVEAALDRVLTHKRKEVPAEEGECAVAAAEVVARLRGKWGEESAYSETADAWVRRYNAAPPVALVEKAVAALDRLSRAPSELLELWDEGQEAQGWLESIAELRHRLTD